MFDFLLQAGWGGDPDNGPLYPNLNTNNPNYGHRMPNCLKQCGTPSAGSTEPATFGAAGRPIGTECEACPAIKTGFYFAWNQQPGGTLQVYLYTPAVIAPDVAESAGDCLAEFGQVGDMGAWYVGGAAPLVAVTTATTSLEACAAVCKGNDACEYITFDYKADDDTKRCFMKLNSDADKQYAEMG